MKKQKNQKQSASQPADIPPAMKVFSKTRDIDTNGDMEMYSQQKLQKRQQLSKDPDLRREIQNIVKMYELKDGKILQQEYKRMQKKMALALRPEIDSQELEFVVDQDWKLDQKDGAILPEDMSEKIFELVDVWTIGVDKLEYISFTKILGKKITKKN